MIDDLVKRARHNAKADMPHYASAELIETMADRIEELIEEGVVMAQKLDAAEAKLAKAVRLMELSIELATWNTTLLDDVILFTTEMKEETE